MMGNGGGVDVRDLATGTNFTTTFACNSFTFFFPAPCINISCLGWLICNWATRAPVVRQTFAAESCQVTPAQDASHAMFLTLTY